MPLCPLKTVNQGVTGSSPVGGARPNIQEPLSDSLGAVLVYSKQSIELFYDFTFVGMCACVS